MLYSEMGSSRIRWWDFMIFLPNLAFGLFLLLRFQVTRAKLLGPGHQNGSSQRSPSPIMLTFYILIVMCVITSLLRSIISMALDSTTLNGEATDKLFWILDRFFLLSTEISVIVFGLAFGHLDSRTSIKRVLLVTSFISLVYSSIQGSLELTSPDERYYIHDPTRTSDIALFSHGGTVFWSITCIIFSIIYFFISILPLVSSQSSTTFSLCLLINIRTRLTLPSKKSFYIYSFVLSLLNLVQAVGSIMFYHDIVNGLCLINMTTFTYFSFFIPFIYYSFLSDYFRINPSTILYKHFNQSGGYIDSYINDLMVEDETSSYPSTSNGGVNQTNGAGNPMAIPTVNYAGINYTCGPSYDVFTGETSVLSLKTTDHNLEDREEKNQRESVLSQAAGSDPQS